MLLPPILGQVKRGVRRHLHRVGVALTVFNVASALLQTPAGFLVDRIGPRAMLTGGLIARRGGASRPRPAAGLLVLRHRLRPDGRRQHRLSPGRLFDPVGHHRRQEHRQGLLDPYVRGISGLRRDARHGAGLGRALGLARRLPVRRRPGLARGDAADRGRQRPAARVRKPPATGKDEPQEPAGRSRPAVEPAGPAQPPVLPLPRHGQWRHPDLFRGGAWARSTARRPRSPPWACRASC